MKKALNVTLIVDVGVNSLAELEQAIAQHLEKEGWNVATSHLLDRDQMTLEYVKEPIGKFDYEKA